MLFIGLVAAATKIVEGNRWLVVAGRSTKQWRQLPLNPDHEIGAVSRCVGAVTKVSFMRLPLASRSDTGLFSYQELLICGPGRGDLVADQFELAGPRANQIGVMPSPSRCFVEAGSIFVLRLKRRKCRP